MGLRFRVRQVAKMGMEHIILPFLYFIFSFQRTDRSLVIFADAHHNSCPYSMALLRHRVRKLGRYKVRDFYLDMGSCSVFKMICFIISFEKAYAKAGHVFICDNFLPVSACKKKKGTFVTQLWHSGGLLKKAGYDSEDTIPGIYKGEVFRNYDLWTVSSPACTDIIKTSMHQPDGVVKPTGISRSDLYFSSKRNERLRAEFFAAYPEAKGKTVVLWAPTFRGNAGQPYVVGEEAVEKAFSDDRFFLIKKLHPHMKGSDAPDFPSERLFPAADILITDYSSIVFDYLAYSKPFVFFAPDLDEFLDKRGLYVDYFSFPTTVAKNSWELRAAAEHEFRYRNADELKECYRFHMSSCDGKATERILKAAGLTD